MKNNQPAAEEVNLILPAYDIAFYFMPLFCTSQTPESHHPFQKDIGVKKRHRGQVFILHAFIFFSIFEIFLSSFLSFLILSLTRLHA